MITEFYKNSEIFITGGSGVLGKAAIEKLLRSCDVKKIYVLIRSKKNSSPEERLSEMKNSKIFKVLRGLKPDEMDKKLIAIPGDITQDCLGISEEYKLMMANVTIFIHLAASTRFNLSLRTAIEANLKSTQKALKLAESFKNLKIFLYVSTFYSNPDVVHIEDKVYPAIFDWKTAMNLLNSEHDQMEPVFHAIESKLIQDFPNTYVFTKHLAEQLVNDYRHKLPVAIFRPSIVTAAFQEPEPGYTESMTGVMGLLSIWGTGLIQVLLCNPKLILDLTPLDASTKFLLIFTAKSAKLERKSILEKTPVGMFSSWGILRHPFGEFGKFLSAISRENPLEKSIWIPHVTMTTSSVVYWVYLFCLQLFPAFIIDVFLKLFGQKPIMMAIQRKIYFASDALRFFISNQFASDGATDFKELLVSTKGTEFDINYLDGCCRDDKYMREVLELQMKGCRKFLLKEDESSLPRCRNIFKVKMFVYNVIRAYVIYVVGKFIYRSVMN
ncbi:fatty acyl-CoA reductase 1-like [Episyrphus balteatus]|uniref:fatty acyl-CoA reductase 1-like n=1 Tax=Episyrphus balteatus TaxID=286459 RepID=UPI00248550E0|nr:fatty acyl-CoA reductase 1-like [Episyrphus balteatus]